MCHKIRECKLLIVAPDPRYCSLGTRPREAGLQDYMYLIPRLSYLVFCSLVRDI